MSSNPHDSTLELATRLGAQALEAASPDRKAALQAILAATQAGEILADTLIGLAFDGFKEIRLDSDRPAPIRSRMMAPAMVGGAASAPPSAEAEDVTVSVLENCAVDVTVPLFGGKVSLPLLFFYNFESSTCSGILVSLVCIL